MTFYTLSTVLQLAFLYGVIAIAVAFTFRIVGFPDLTPDGAFVVGAAIAAVVVRSGHNAALAIVLGAGAGGLSGVTTAMLHAKLGVSKLLSGILVTLALYSISLRVMMTSNLSLLNVQTFMATVARGSGAAPILATAAICCTTLSLAIWLLRTRLGISLRATGDSETALEVRGRLRQPYYFIGLAFANAIVAAGGVIVALYQGFADVSMGTGLVVTCLAAVVMGETVLRPQGIVSLMLSPVLGMFVYQLVLALALRAGFTPADLKISTAVIAIAFIGLDRLRTQRGEIGRQIGNRAV